MTMHQAFSEIRDSMLKIMGVDRKTASECCDILEYCAELVERGEINGAQIMIRAAKDIREAIGDDDALVE